ncbi:hypothetical protein [Devosia nitrariae]|uniref:FAD dependent oxidoreductase domain-containing protein n=1 Tax=Devosia nitrariae TaxID=2071872 RepID=A0ABQ5W626_9HYPH|nr:hypothetical protein [Devosia nitrariae]GLQ55060.1 hypothetical protein GCM10010862_23190 [Devosia nitrariae]
MNSREVDIAVFGSGLLARLLAGLLAQAHGRRVALVTQSDAAYRLARSFDISVAPVTRPETWALLAQTVPETLRLLAQMGGRTACQRLDPLFVTTTQRGRQGLAHIRHMAAGFGHDAQVLPAEALGADREGLILRDAVLLMRGEAEPLADAWLAGLGVPVLQQQRVHAEVSGGGTARIEAESIHLEASMAVLADDAAVLAHAGHGIGGLLEARSTSALLAGSSQTSWAPFVVDVDGGTQVLQTGPHALTVVAAGETDDAAEVVIDLLRRPTPLHVWSRTSFRQLIARDGAPVVGRPQDRGAMVLAGLGLTSAFIAPALARWLAGTASQAEDGYFAARGFSRTSDRSPVAEFAPLSARQAGAPA